MCGIAGVVNHAHSEDAGCSMIMRMLTRIKHRGPDECGYFSEPGTVFGNVRLSIIDLKSGQQPLSTPDRRYWIAYNGEVFNYLELRDELIARGHSFNTHCDTEVVVHLYQEYGPACLSKLNGQFAIAIWDREKKELFLARDRVGIRPLFYSNVGKTLVFASEIKSIFEFPGIERKLSVKGINQVLTFWVAIPPQTAFEGVNELPPGHYMVFKDGHYTVTRFWCLKTAFKAKRFDGSFDEAKEQLGQILRDSVSLRLRSDVPVAAYLSGGLDSSATTALIREIAPGHLNTFSIGFAEKEFDETPYQREVSQYFQTNHHSVTCNSHDIAEWFPSVVWHSEVPLLRTSPAPMYGLSKLVRQNNIKVVITGEGADEALGGYNIFKEAIIRHFWAKQPQSKIRPLLLRKLYPYIPSIKNGNVMALRMFFGYNLAETQSPAYSHLLRWNNTGNTRKFLSDGFSMGGDTSLVDDYVNSLGHDIDDFSPLAKAQYIETSLFMSGYLLAAQGDRVAMANSVEGRYPFLDYRLLEFCASLPDEFKIKGLNEKYILKEFIKNQIPDSVTSRSKQAYRAPIHQAFLNGNAPEYVKDILSSQSLADSGVFNPQLVNKLLDKMRQSEQPSEMENMALVAILSTQLLHRQFIKEYSHLNDKQLIKGVKNN
jgi:asparagine synthase (glutamine-hydrolysing)